MANASTENFNSIVPEDSSAYERASFVPKGLSMSSSSVTLLSALYH